MREEKWLHNLAARTLAERKIAEKSAYSLGTLGHEKGTAKSTPNTWIGLGNKIVFTQTSHESEINLKAQAKSNLFA